ncbi:hypothetical protein V6N13_107592 [Hibiscus sabdariffa]|uniref:Uncharacterized protein n=1 Tax=Hibiscus sabdariffa TaxID=183260 RepID=A0ABR2SPW5_9ROSI
MFVQVKNQLQVPSEKSMVLDDQTHWNTTYQMLAAATEWKCLLFAGVYGIHEVFLEYVRLGLPLAPNYAEEGNAGNGKVDEFQFQNDLLID